jgi:HPr kinase/phosphorylase
MPFKPRVKKPEFISVQQFFQHASETLGMENVGSEAGMARRIQEPSVNRPGLALAGFFDYFAFKRVQVMGNSELSYIDELEDDVRLKRCRRLCEENIPCIVVARGRGVPDDLIVAANDARIPIFQTEMMTMKFLNLASMHLEALFSPTMTVHGSMVDVQGIGVLIQGPSGTGKSEAVVGLLERGASLVADDKVNLRLNEDREIICTADEIARGMLEMRGLGLVDVTRMFGIGALRLSKRLDLVVHLQPGVLDPNAERTGVETKTEELLGLQVPTVTLPVVAGRDVSSLVHLAALHKKLHTLGVNPAAEFNQRLLKKMTDNQLA